MNTEFLENALNPYGITNQLTAPGRKLSALMVEHTEKLVRLNLEAARVYTDIGLSQLRAMASIHDSESLQQYIANQASVAEGLVRRATEDAETVAGIGNEFANDISRIAGENVTVLRDAVKPAAKTSTTKPKTTARANRSSTTATRAARPQGSGAVKGGSTS